MRISTEAYPLDSGLEFGETEVFRGIAIVTGGDEIVDSSSYDNQDQPLSQGLGAENA